MSNIPKIIHYMWLGEKPLSEQTKKYIETWKQHNPDYKIMEWNEKNVDTNCCDFVHEAYLNKKYAFIADYVRLKALKEYGGIWLDTDVEVTKSFDDLLSLNGFLSFENEAYTESAIMGSSKNSNYINLLYDFYFNRKFIKNNKMDLTPNTVIQSIFLKEYFGLKYKNVTQNLADELTVFTSDYFAPKDYTTGEITITKNTYAIHNFVGSWVGKNATFQAKFLRAVRKILGKKIFGFFTRCYIKSQEKTYLNEYKKIINMKEKIESKENKKEKEV